MTVDEAILVLRSAINYIDYCTQCDDPDPKCKTNGDECTIAFNTLVKKLTSDNNDCTATRPADVV